MARAGAGAADLMLTASKPWPWTLPRKSSAGVRPRTLGPYRPGERRIIRLTLRNDPEVETISESEADANGCKRITIRKKHS